MDGPYRIEDIRVYVNKDSIGVYTLHIDSASIVGYVGRSDKDLLREIFYRVKRRNYLAGIRYSYFSFEETSSVEQAYKRECELWHKHGGEERKLDQSRHPSRPGYSWYRCPIPSCRYHRRF